ncbi:MAG: hypothetical protein COT73_00545 [Bdellovibrio sp. CG10_big_fil_rev_8_21_14_0_10_47_8]|nr:MAG: hypothetical protein COT73_00545 [Bdellovibrio sp. CG10_big_fil_rev_8_21_14_0_10_47_8]
MSLDKALKNMKFDVRVTEFNLNHGLGSKEELKKHLDALPDLTAQSEKLILEDEKPEPNQQH